MRVYLFIPCLIDQFHPETGANVVRILRKIGAEISYPEKQICCGQPFFKSGQWKKAVPLAKNTMDAFRGDGLVVGPSGSCVKMIKHHYLDLFAKDPEWLARAEDLSARVYEFSEFLVDYLGVIELGAYFPARIAYHPSCHLLRDLGVKSQPCDLLEAVEEAELVELPNLNECCGFGGVFSAEQPEISTAMLERKIKNLEESESDVLVTCDAGCMTHINGGLRRLGKPVRAVHIAQILANRPEIKISLD